MQPYIVVKSLPRRRTKQRWRPHWLRIGVLTATVLFWVGVAYAAKGLL